MNPELQQKIITRHGHLVSHSDSPSYVSNPGTPSVENSGPPSPTSGPIVNFAEVSPGLYRSSFPRSGNFEHLQSLGLKTILTLVGEDYPAENVVFMEENGIQHFQIPIPAHKDPSIVIPAESIAKALKIISDRSNYPLLVHCNKGKHRTGCIMACYRKIYHDWKLDAILTEYRKYAGSKWRTLDVAFISRFEPEDVLAMIEDTKGIPFPATKQPPLSTVPFPTPPASDGYEWEED